MKIRLITYAHLIRALNIIITKFKRIRIIATFSIFLSVPFLSSPPDVSNFDLHSSTIRLQLDYNRFVSNFHHDTNFYTGEITQPRINQEGETESNFEYEFNFVAEAVLLPDSFARKRKHAFLKEICSRVAHRFDVHFVSAVIKRGKGGPIIGGAQ